MCRLFGCEKQAPYPMPCCSMTHGVQFKRDKKDYEMYVDGEKLSNWYQDGKSLPNWPVAKLEHMYAKS